MALFRRRRGIPAATDAEVSALRDELEHHQRFTEVLLETIEVGIVFCDADGSGWVRNRAERALLGLDGSAAQGKTPEAAARLVDVLDLSGRPIPVTEYPLTRALRGEEVGAVDLLLGPSGGPHRQVISHSAQIVSADGVVLGAVSTLTDVSVERAGRRDLSDQNRRLVEAHRAGREAEALFQTVFDQAGIGALILGLDGVPTRVNAAACVLLGRPVDLLVGRLWTEYNHPEDVPPGEMVRARLDAGDDSFGDERRFLRPDRSVVWASTHVTLVRDDQGAPDYLLVQLSDITDRKRMEEELEHLALHDSLTGLANRALFVERARQALTAAPEPVAVVVLLVAGLSAVIERDGYAVGDLVLKEVARRLRGSLGEDVTIAHLQHGQFGILVKGGTHDAVHAADLSRATMMNPFDQLDGTISLSAHVGISAALAGGPGGVASVGRLIQDAAMAARRASVDGADGIAFASTEMREEQEKQQRIEALVRDALEHDKIGVAYQPVFDLETGLVVGAEALLRVSDEHDRLVPPQDLIPVAEESGLIVKLGLRVLQLAAGQAARWRAELGVSVPIAVNVSAVQLERDDFIDEVLRTVEQAGVPPQALSIELTESVLLRAGSAGIEKLRDLRDAGFNLAIDDFGTGYASLSYLQQLPASTLKIDRSFVDGIPHDRGAVAIVAAVVGLARNFGMTCIAEGIETQEQRDYFAGLKVRGQGYLLGRPGTGAAIGQMLASAPSAGG